MNIFTTITDEWTPFLEGIAALTEDNLALFEPVGEAVKQCTLENFGVSGTNRPRVWPPLSKDYARKVKRDYATLDVSGELKNSITVEVAETSIVATDEKASYHQLGEGYNKERPFFPISKDGELTEYCQQRITEALDQHFAAK